MKPCQEIDGRFDRKLLETLWIMNGTYRTSAMPTIMVGFCWGETPKNSFGKQALSRKLWLEFMESSVWYGKTIQELSWRICFIQPPKKKLWTTNVYSHISRSIWIMGLFHGGHGVHPSVKLQEFQLTSHQNQKIWRRAPTPTKKRKKNVGFETNHLLPRYS